MTTTATKHTPGPWKDGPSTFTRGETPYHEYACGCRASALGMSRCQTHAAAPDLLAALDTMLRAADTLIFRPALDDSRKIDHDTRALRDVLEPARAAIRKATGP